LQPILLLSIVSKLFRKLTSRALESQVHYGKSSVIDSISMKIPWKSSLWNSSSTKKPRN